MQKMTDEKYTKILELLENIYNKLEDIEKMERGVTTLKKGTIKTKNKIVKNKIKQYKGLTGGINFLIDNQFFNKLCSVSEVIIELKREGYHYSIKSVDKILRDFHTKRILTRFQEDKKWKYVIRK